MNGFGTGVSYVLLGALGVRVFIVPLSHEEKPHAEGRPETRGLDLREPTRLNASTASRTIYGHVTSLTVRKWYVVPNDH